MSLRRMMMYSGKPAPSLQNIGTLLGDYRGGAPVSTVEQDGYNTIHTNYFGVTSINRFYDFSGQGNHLTTDIYSTITPAGSAAYFNGSGYTNMDEITGGGHFHTVFIKTDAMPTGYWFYSVGGTRIYMGDLTGSLTGETISAVIQETPTIDYLATDAPIPTGFKNICTVFSHHDSSQTGIYLNGQPQSLITGQKTVSNLGSTFGLGRNPGNTGNRLVGNVERILLYFEELPPASVAILEDLT